MPDGKSLAEAQRSQPAAACPVCTSPQTLAFAEDNRRTYRRCAACQAIFVPPQWHLDAAAARHRYEQHDNSRGNAGYVRYLSMVADQVMAAAGDDIATTVLDYGCGADCVLEMILQARGVACQSYDPVFGKLPPPAPEPYDVIVLSEVIEHFADVDAEMRQIKLRLRANGGLLFIRTKLVHAELDFRTWWYKNDPTHIVFFSLPTMSALASRHGLIVQRCDHEVTVMRAGGATAP